MTDKYKILKTDEKSGNELTITFRVKSDKSTPFESSINVHHNAPEEAVLKWINDAAHNLIERRAKKKKKEDIKKVNLDALKKSLDKHKDVDVDITEPDDDRDNAFK